jgi:glutamate synthase domain-containing protein 3
MTELRAETTRYTELNEQIKEIAKNPGEITVKGVYGQRYMGCALKSHTRLNVYGTLGNDSACYMDGATLEVFGNAQDGIANTMNDGALIIHGNCGDIMGYAMRGGSVFVQGYAGYRSGIHMKEYMDKTPKIVIGTKAGDFLGEYMAGGRIVVLGLGLKNGELAAGRFFGTGIHGGKIYIRGRVNDALIGKEVATGELSDEDKAFLKQTIDEYAKYFDVSVRAVKIDDFRKYEPKSSRPYGSMYVAN